MKNKPRVSGISDLPKEPLNKHDHHRGGAYRELANEESARKLKGLQITKIRKREEGGQAALSPSQILQKCQSLSLRVNSNPVEVSK